MVGMTSYDQQWTESAHDIPNPSIETVLAPREGEDPWSWDGKSALLLTGRGTFVVRRETHYSYAVRARRADFRTVFGDTGREFAREVSGSGPSGAIQLATRVPQEILSSAWSFLAAAWRAYGTEDILLLNFFPKERRYDLTHPSLSFASAGRVGYEQGPASPGAVRFGTIHSHPAVSAFHSETDDADVLGVPGIHVVIGDLDLPLPSLACVLSTGERCVHLHPADVFAPPSPCAFPPEWLQRPSQSSTVQRSGTPCVGEEVPHVS